MIINSFHFDSWLYTTNSEPWARAPLPAKEVEQDLLQLSPKKTWVKGGFFCCAGCLNSPKALPLPWAESTSPPQWPQQGLSFPILQNSAQEGGQTQLSLLTSLSHYLLINTAGWNVLHLLLDWGFYTGQPLTLQWGPLRRSWWQNKRQNPC